MDCREFQELITEAVDRRLNTPITNHFNAHAQACPLCRNDFERERITKAVLHSKVQHQAIPSSVSTSLLAVVENLRPSARSWRTMIFGEANLNPAVALVAILFVVVGVASLLQTNNAVPLANNRNIITQSLNNYSAAMTGTLKPTLISHDPDAVKNFLAKDTPFEVSVAALSDCDWCGGVLSEIDGVRLVHVVYKIGGEGLLYVYQVDMSEALRGNKIGLPEKAKASLAKTGWYFEQTPDLCNVVLWRHKNTLCAAVSKIGKDKMIALLSEKDQ